MEKVWLKLLKPWKSYEAGDVVSVPPGIMPLRMLRTKTAKRYVPVKHEDETDADNNS
jgi:hypothetical protein